MTNPFAREAYAHAAAICRERAAAHHATTEKSELADKRWCEAQAREAEKCALAIEAAMRDAPLPARSSFLPTQPLAEAQNDNANLRTRSGEVNINSRLVGFIYDLVRDHLPLGTVEAIVRECKISDINYTNGWLARYAEDVAARLEGRIE